MRFLFLTALSCLTVAGLYFLTELALVDRLSALRQQPTQQQAPPQRSPKANNDMAAAALPRLPTLYLAHGGGPLPVLGDPASAGLARFMKAWPKTVPKPEAILVISAHWEVGGCCAAAGGVGGGVGRCVAGAAHQHVEMQADDALGPKQTPVRLTSQPAWAPWACCPPRASPLRRLCLLQEPRAKVTSAPAPDLIYDYYGFPPGGLREVGEGACHAARPGMLGPKATSPTAHAAWVEGRGGAGVG